MDRNYTYSGSDISVCYPRKFKQLKPSKALLRHLLVTGEMDQREATNLKHHIIPSTLKLTIGFNASDATYGWKGAHDSFTVFYIHHSLESSFSRTADSSHSLMRGVSPMVSFQLQTTYYLNEPYTKCNSSSTYTKRDGIEGTNLVQGC